MQEKPQAGHVQVKKASSKYVKRCLGQFGKLQKS
jgi:hypothetical protein